MGLSVTVTVLAVLSLASSSLAETSVLSGPGLKPLTSVLPCRYFFINTTDITDYRLAVTITGQSEAGLCQPRLEWRRLVDQELVMVRYKLHQTCHNLEISVTASLEHLPGSPVNIQGPALPDSCHCPNPSLERWREDNQCPPPSQQMQQDLAKFSSGVDMKAVVAEARSVLSHGGSQCWCHYVLKAGEIYRTCYGQHTGFKMFWDSLLTWLVRRTTIPDTELIVNLGDWPLVKTKDKPLPMISWCGSHDTIDLVLPTYELTEASIECMGRQSVDVLASLTKNAVPWQEKVEKLFWRGRDSNKERLRLVRMARKYPEFINASITAFFFFRDEEAELGKTPHVSFFEFFNHKYQLCIDGTVAAYRLPYLLAGGSVVFKTESKYYEHFYPDLEPWVHYIPVNEDLSNLVERIQWAREHDEKSFEIAQNARSFALHNLLPDHVLCYYATFISGWAKLVTNTVEVGEGMEKLTVDKNSCQCSQQNKGKDEF